MKGVQYLVNDKGRITGVLIDLREHGRLWEDLYDSLLARCRKGEPREPLQVVKRRLHRRWGAISRRESARGDSHR